ncbi:MAG: YsnF/AvaK domain-containing protein, partial [Chloroflexi bacterium]|nr:YsnF/AvaK domain-containing protein [Chloroflexota bacterium]
DVVTEERTLEVPVTEERVRVERRVVDRPVSAADADAFEETVIDVPVTTETVDVQKQARVAEEVVLSKEAAQRTERVSDTVRKEEVFIDDEGDVDASLREGSARDTRRGR